MTKVIGGFHWSPSDNTFLSILANLTSAMISKVSILPQISISPILFSRFLVIVLIIITVTLIFHNFSKHFGKVQIFQFFAYHHHHHH